MGRLDNRSLRQFKDHIKFTTEIEARLMELWAESSSSKCDWYVDNGVDNSGGYIKDGRDTSDVDFVASVGGEVLQLEMKFVPTYGKLSLKAADVANYIRKGASILFIFNYGKETLKVPPKRCIETHWGRILDAHSSDFLRWGIMKPENVRKVREQEERVFIPYMGNKPGYIINSNSFRNYMRIRRLDSEV